MGSFASWFSSKLREHRFSHRQFAEFAGVSKSAVGAWASGERLPGPDSCQKIAVALDVGWDEVLTRAGHRESGSEFELDDLRQRVIDMVSALDPSDETVSHWLKTTPLVLADMRRVIGQESE